MKSTFKVARPGGQLNIVAYTGPPPPKPKRLPAPPRREEVMEEYSLPDLAPNSVFDEVDTGTVERVVDLGSSAFVDDVCKASVSLVQDAEAMNTNLAAAERPAHRSCKESAENEAVHVQSASPVPMPTYDSAARESQRSSPIQDIHTGEIELVDSPGLDSDNPACHEITSAQSTQSHAVRECDSVSPKPESKRSENEKLGSENLEGESPENTGRKTPHDHVMSSDSDISNFEFRSLDDPGSRKRTACALRSVKSSLEIVVPNRHVPFGQAEPKSASMPQISSKMKMPRALPGTRTRPYGHQTENSLPKRKRGHLTMGRPNIKRRSWRATQATAKNGRLHSDSGSSCDDTTDVDSADDVRMRPKARQLPKLSSKARTASQSRVRRGDHTISASIGSRSKVNSQGGNSHTLAQSFSVSHVNGASAVCTPPVLPKPTVHAATSTETAVMTGLLTDIADIEPLLQSSAAWGFSDGPSSTRLVSATIKPQAAKQWQLTATFERVSSGGKTLSDLGFHVHDSGLTTDDDSLFSIHHESSEDEDESANRTRTVTRTRNMRRGAWEEDEDNKLIRWRLRGESWPWILDQFPNRTEGAVKSRWYVVLAPQQKRQNGRDR